MICALGPYIGERLKSLKIARAKQIAANTAAVAAAQNSSNKQVTLSLLYHSSKDMASLLMATANLDQHHMLTTTEQGQEEEESRYPAPKKFIEVNIYLIVCLLGCLFVFLRLLWLQSFISLTSSPPLSSLLPLSPSLIFYLSFSSPPLSSFLFSLPPLTHSPE